MDGFRAFKYYTALKLHFTTDKFNVFVNRGHVRGSYERFSARNDRMLFEKLARQYNDREFIQYIASNFMYGNPDMVYDLTDATANYKEFLRRKQSITHIFSSDLNKLIDAGIDCQDYHSMLQLMMRKVITLETLVILDDLADLVNTIKRSAQMSLMLEDELRLITKSKGFVKYDSYKIMAPFTDFLEESKAIQNG